jgi:hypothetical protein
VLPAGHNIQMHYINYHRSFKTLAGWTGSTNLFIATEKHMSCFAPECGSTGARELT